MALNPSNNGNLEQLALKGLKQNDRKCIEKMNCFASTRRGEELRVDYWKSEMLYNKLNDHGKTSRQQSHQLCFTINRSNHVELVLLFVALRLMAEDDQKRCVRALFATRKITSRRIYTRSLSNAMCFKHDNNVYACAVSALILLPAVNLSLEMDSATSISYATWQF